MLAGDHVYKMDYARMLRFHLDRGAAVTIATIETPVSEAGRFGIVQVDESDRVIGFQEKPCDPKPIPGSPQVALAALGTVAVISKHELLLLMVGGVFVIEAVSVIFQVASFKSRGKRIFLMAPIHHHFEMKGWEEPKVVVRLWIIAILLALLSLSTLKLR